MKIEINIPDGKSGPWKVDNFTVSKDDAAFHNMRASIRDGRYITPGTYHRLMCGSETVMSNTPSEISDHRKFIRIATGNILINGLGLGMCINALLEKESVKSITVIEKSEDVIKLVSPHITDERVKIIHADALEYKSPKGMRYDAVWHDIWTYIDYKNLEDMKKLHRKYGRKTDWQGSWCRKECEYLRDH